MKVYSGELTLIEPQHEVTVSVPAGTTLADVHEIISRSRAAYVLVVDLEDNLLGIASRSRIQDVTDRHNERERERWMSMPIESVMLSMMARNSDHIATGRSTAIEQSGPHTLDWAPIMDRGQIVGVVHADDLLVSFDAIEPVLARATTDAVTGLPLRSIFERRLSEEWNRAMRSGESLSVILVDVDHFKKVNDCCGHAVGDAVLHMVASCLRRSLRSYDVVCRYGGDEFAAIFFGCRPDEIDIPISRLMKEIGRLSIPTGDGNCHISLSIGAATVYETMEQITPRALVEAADRCLYHSKENGRNCAFRTNMSSRNEFDPVPVTQPAESHTAIV